MPSSVGSRPPGSNGSACSQPPTSMSIPVSRIIRRIAQVLSSSRSEAEQPEDVEPQPQVPLPDVEIAPAQILGRRQPDGPRPPDPEDAARHGNHEPSAPAGESNVRA